MSVEFSMKVGDTLLADCVHKDAAGVAVDLDAAGITIKSAIRTEDGQTRYDLEVERKDQAVTPGGFKIEADSSSWRPGKLRWDIRYFQAGRSFSTRTIVFLLDEPVA